MQPWAVCLMDNILCVYWRQQRLRSWRFSFLMPVSMKEIITYGHESDILQVALSMYIKQIICDCLNLGEDRHLCSFKTSYLWHAVFYSSTYPSQVGCKARIKDHCAQNSHFTHDSKSLYSCVYVSYHEHCHMPTLRAHIPKKKSSNTVTHGHFFIHTTRDMNNAGSASCIRMLE